MSNYLNGRTNYDLFDDRFFNALFSDDKKSRLMRTDIIETDNGYELHCDLPGYTKENVKITYDKGYLTINANTKTENNDNTKNFVRKERYYGEVTRTYYMGEDIDEESIKASFSDGVLKITVPKVEKKEPVKKYITIL